MMRSRGAGVQAGLLLLLSGTATAAIAQTAAVPDAAGISGTTAEDQDSRAEDLVITGSRIARRGTDSPSPVSILSSQQIEQAGLPQIADVVNELPSLAITQNDQTSNLAGNPGINALDLRGLGTQRTLVLVDGRRHVPAIPGTSAVDVSTIPSSLVERVEILTGGASALYGADAVAGVANFILKKNYQGFGLDARVGQSTYGDFPTYDLSLTAGRNFADGRGNITLYGFYEDEPGTISGQDRPWTAKPYPIYSRSDRNAKYTVQDGVLNIYSGLNAQTLLGGKLYSFNPNGTLRAPQLGPGGIVNRQAIDTSNPFNLGDLLTDGGEYTGRYDDYFLQVPARRITAHGSANYEVSDALKLFFTGDYSNNRAMSAGAPYTSFGSDVVPGDSPFVTDEMRAAAGSDLADGVNFSRKYAQLGIARTIFHRQMFELIGGLDGKFSLLSKPWTYSAFYSYGKSIQRRRDVNSTANGRYQNALDTTTGPNGQPICRSTLTDPTNGCVPLNPFADLTQQQIDYIQYDTDYGRSTLQQQVASAYVSGGLFTLPGGDVQLVLGGEYRKESQHIGTIPQYDPQNALYDPEIGTSQTPLTGGYTVKEAFSEVHVPILAHTPFFQTLSVDGAVRLSDYSTAGHTTTWKAGGEWAPVRDLRFRSTYGQAVRAPNIGELYTQSSIGGRWITDPCNTYNVANRLTRTQYTAANCALVNPSDKATYWLYRNIITQGNLELKPEVARTLTIGGVLEPHWIPNLAITVDYYSIRIKDAIATFDPQQIIEHCIDASTLQNPYCGFVARDAGNNLLSVTTENLNLSDFKTRGIDVELTYRLPLSALGLGPNSGTISIDSAYTRLLKHSFQLDPTDPTTLIDTTGVFGSPKWKGVTRTTWTNGPFSFTWSLRHFGPMRPTTTTTSDLYAPYKTGNVFYNDFSASIAVTPTVEFYGGTHNAFNRAPPRLPGAEAGGANFETTYTAGVYDSIGRTMWVGLRLRLK